MTKLGILAYGSLIECPGKDLEPLIRDRIKDVETPFAVEFARSSSKRGHAPTVICVDDGGAPVRATILVLSSEVTLDRAKYLLWIRERHREDTGGHYSPPAKSGINDVLVEQLDNFHSIDKVLYTKIGANIEPKKRTPEHLADLAIKSVAKAEKGKDGISYLISLKRQGIETPLLPEYKAAILKKTGTSSLEDALTTIRDNSLLRIITDFYVNSHDYNGIPVRDLLRGSEETKLKEELSALVGAGLVSILYGDRHPNPHIKAFPDEPVEQQIAKLETSSFQHACVYPAPKHLETVVDKTEYHDRPYDLCLALGELQVIHKAFDLSVLEHYRNDPRYTYRTSEISGNISVRDAYYQTEHMKPSDEVVLQTFGFCYDDEQNRYVAVFLRYLADLTPEHQQVWRAKEATVSTKLHPDYFRASIMGEWPIGMSIFGAVLAELQLINKMAQAMGRPLLFKEDFSIAERPRAFSFLIRPTLKEFNDFVHELDKMLSDNINKEFFQREVPYEREETRKDGKIVVREKGTIQILDDWLKKRFKAADRKPIEEALSSLRKVRQLRQKPAHSINENKFDQQYVHEQRELMKEVYGAVNTIRQIFAKHPATKGVKVSSALEEGKIWTM